MITKRQRNAALAKLFGSKGYEPAETCPQGHHFYDEEYRNFLPHVGDLCEQCVEDNGPTAAPTGSLVLRSLLRKKWGIEASMHRDDMAWHPEWRVRVRPKDFTIPGILEPLVRRLLACTTVEGWTMSYDRGYFAYQVVLGGAIGYGHSYEEALGEALLAYVNKEGTGRR